MNKEINKYKNMEKETKNRCQLSQEGLGTFGKQRRGYVLGEARNGGLRILWDGLKTPSVYAKSFIEINPLLELFTDEEGIQKEKPIEDPIAQITPETILKIEDSLDKLKNVGISNRALEILVKDYCGQRVSITQIRTVLNSLPKIKAYYFPTHNPHG